MWIRIACPNGHSLDQRELRFAVRSGTCPKCLAVVSMWVKVNCPNGHGLKVRTKFAGKTGKCPECQAAVAIPDLTEETIIALLGKVGKPEGSVLDQPEKKSEDVLEAADSALGGSTLIKRLPKQCPKCKQMVSAKYTICPHCRTFLPFTDVAEAAELGGQRSSMNCPGCGVRSFPGDTVCNNCGQTLVD
jgi:hypothetical protein